MDNVGLPPDKVIREKLIEAIKEWTSYSTLTRNPYLSDTISLHEFKVGSPQPYGSRYAHLPAASIDGVFYYVEIKFSVQKTYPETTDRLKEHKQFLADMDKGGVERALNRGKGRGDLETWFAFYYLYKDSLGDWRVHPHEHKLLSVRSVIIPRGETTAVVIGGLVAVFGAAIAYWLGKPKDGEGNQ